jgi:membrane AbrB-like protein
MRLVPKFRAGTDWIGAAGTLAIAAAGAGLFWLAGLPAPFLTGPALAVSLASLAGRSADLPAPLRDAVFVVLGVGIGASVTPEVIAGIRTWPLSLSMLAATLVAIIVACRTLLQRRFGFDRLSALLAGTPGHLSYVLAISESQGGATGRVALVQSMRVLFLTLAVPALIALGGLQAPRPALPPPAMTLPGGLISFAAAIALALVFRRLRLPAALLIGALLASALLHGSGLVVGRLPNWLGLSAFLVMGALIGTRFRGQTWAATRAALGAGLAVTGVSCGVAVLAALAVAAIIGLPVVQVLIAFAPGGLEAMAAMALLTNADPAFVAAHHVARMMLLSVMVPMFLRRQG